jgi:undecaprenyl-diphosphatase
MWMNAIETLFLGIVQGLTEFLPVSSSGHLVVFQNLLGFREPELLLDCTLHMGTLLAVCIYLRKDIIRICAGIMRGEFRSPDAFLGWMVAAGSIPTALIGFTFKDQFERMFGSVAVVGVMLAVTGLILVSSLSAPKAARLAPETLGGRIGAGLLAALIVGTAQGLAIIPGISRSGTTIVAGLLCGMEKGLAGRFSFLLSIPAIVGALALQLKDGALTRVGPWPLVVGFAVSALVGFAALSLLMRTVRNGHLHYFAPYCWAVGLAAFIASKYLST